MLPDLSRLSMPELADEGGEREKPEEIGVAAELAFALQQARDGAAAAYTAAYEYWYPQVANMPCPEEDAKPTMLIATSELWMKRQLNVTERVNDWRHLDEKSQIEAFFRKASEQGAPGTLAHVVRTRKKASGSTWQRCVDQNEMDVCDPGHVAVVLEPLFEDPSEKGDVDVVSMGFFSNEGNIMNLVPGYPDRGGLLVPDPMVKNWPRLAGNIFDGPTPNVLDHIQVLKTFVYPREKMEDWKEILTRHVSDNRLPRFFSGYRLNGPFYSIYSGLFDGLPELKYASEVGKTLYELDAKMNALDELLNVTTGLGPGNEGMALNCATFVLAAFPDANLECPMGVPAFCGERGTTWEPFAKAMREGLKEGVKDGSAAVFEELLDGIKTMALHATELVTELNGKLELDHLTREAML